jgi:hypothetical protein
MGIDVYLEDEDGNPLAAVPDCQATLQQAIPAIDNHRFCWMNTIDPYGVTLINRLQAPKMRKELELLIHLSEDDRRSRHLNRVDELLKRCTEDVHLYVRFSGD